MHFGRCEISVCIRTGMQTTPIGIIGSRIFMVRARAIQYQTPGGNVRVQDKISNTYIRIRHREHGSCRRPRRLLLHSAIRNAPRKPRPSPALHAAHIHRSYCSLTRCYRGKVKLLSTWNSDYCRNCAKLPSVRKIIQGKLGKQRKRK